MEVSYRFFFVAMFLGLIIVIIASVLYNHYGLATMPWLIATGGGAGAIILPLTAMALAAPEEYRRRCLKRQAEQKKHAN